MLNKIYENAMYYTASANVSDVSIVELEEIYTRLLVVELLMLLFFASTLLLLVSSAAKYANDNESPERPTIKIPKESSEEVSEKLKKSATIVRVLAVGCIISLFLFVLAVVEHGSIIDEHSVLLDQYMDGIEDEVSEEIIKIDELSDDKDGVYAKVTFTVGNEVYARVAEVNIVDRHKTEMKVRYKEIDYEEAMNVGYKEGKYDTTFSVVLDLTADELKELLSEN